MGACGWQGRPPLPQGQLVKRALAYHALHEVFPEIGDCGFQQTGQLRSMASEHVSISARVLEVVYYSTVEISE